MPIVEKSIDQQCDEVAMQCVEEKHYEVWNKWTNQWVPSLCDDCDRVIGLLVGE